MPHLTLEYTRNLVGFEAHRALAALNRALVDSGLFGEADIKSRAVALDCFQTGIRPAARGYAHVRIALLAGRSDAERQQLAEAALAALGPLVSAEAGEEIQLSVETVELHRPSYAKAVIHGG